MNELSSIIVGAGVGIAVGGVFASWVSAKIGELGDWFFARLDARKAARS